MLPQLKHNNLKIVGELYIFANCLLLRQSSQNLKSSEILGLKPRRFTAALLLNLSAFTKYVLECETWKKPIRFDFTPHQHKSRYCGAHWAV
jgi:putative transposase